MTKTCNKYRMKHITIILLWRGSYCHFIADETTHICWLSAIQFHKRSGQTKLNDSSPEEEKKSICAHSHSQDPQSHTGTLVEGGGGVDVTEGDVCGISPFDAAAGGTPACLLQYFLNEHSLFTKSQINHGHFNYQNNWLLSKYREHSTINIIHAHNVTNCKDI